MLGDLAAGLQAPVASSITPAEAGQPGADWTLIEHCLYPFDQDHVYGSALHVTRYTYVDQAAADQALQQVLGLGRTHVIDVGRGTAAYSDSFQPTPSGFASFHGVFLFEGHTRTYLRVREAYTAAEIFELTDGSETVGDLIYSLLPMQERRSQVLQLVQLAGYDSAQ